MPTTPKRPNPRSNAPTSKHPKRARENASAKISKKRRSCGTGSGSDRVKASASACGTGSGSDRVKASASAQTNEPSNPSGKRASKNTPSKISKNEPSNPPRTVAEIVQRAIDDQKSKASNKGLPRLVRQKDLRSHPSGRTAPPR